MYSGLVDGIQLITVFATFGLFLIENLLKIPEIHVVGVVFLQIKCADVYKSSFVQKVVRHIFGILLKFTRQTGMLRIRKITLS